MNKFILPVVLLSCSLCFLSDCKSQENERQQQPAHFEIQFKPTPATIDLPSISYYLPGKLTNTGTRNFPSLQHLYRRFHPSDTRAGDGCTRDYNQNIKTSRIVSVVPQSDVITNVDLNSRVTEKKDKKKKKKHPEDEDDEASDALAFGGMDEEELKELYKLSFYYNPGWYVRHPELPSGTGPMLSSEYFPNPQYGVLQIQHLPPPLPKPLSKSISPLVSNFGGYVGPIVYDHEDGLVFDNKHKDKKKH